MRVLKSRKGEGRHVDRAVTVQVQTNPFLGEGLVKAAQNPWPSHMVAKGTFQTHLGQNPITCFAFSHWPFSDSGIWDHTLLAKNPSFGVISFY